jgi:hypothetical protein
MIWAWVVCSGPGAEQRVFVDPQGFCRLKVAAREYFLHDLQRSPVTAQFVADM